MTTNPTPPAKQIALEDLVETKTVTMTYGDLVALHTAGALSSDARVQEAAARLVALLDDYRPPAAEDAQPRPLDLSHLRNLGISAEEWGRRWDAAVAEATPADAALATARIERDEAQHDAEHCAAERDAAIRRAEDAVDERDRLAAQIAAVRQLCTDEEDGAKRWAEPIPVPEWVAAVRAVLDTQEADRA